MEVFEVFQRRTPEDQLVHVGSLLAPDLDLARLLARETHMRHGEGAECFVARRGDLHAVVHPESMSGILDRSYRTQAGYVGVGARLREVAAGLIANGTAITNARPGDAKADHV